ncbi:hypothetical protein HZ326_17946 [Fusarium oxysporum f. sp. albedinis]|nr:hypothetical protein HZ326_17946 [Fusarium oxysporum f. sp. albedinis]
MYPCHPQLHHIDPCPKGPFLFEHPPGERPVSSRRVCLYVQAQSIPCSCHVMSCHGPGPPNSSFLPLREAIRLPSPFLLLGPQASTFKLFMDSEKAKHKRLIA